MLMLDGSLTTQILQFVNQSALGVVGSTGGVVLRYHQNVNAIVSLGFWPMPLTEQPQKHAFRADAERKTESALNRDT